MRSLKMDDGDTEVFTWCETGYAGDRMKFLPHQYVPWEREWAETDHIYANLLSKCTRQIENVNHACFRSLHDSWISLVDSNEPEIYATNDRLLMLTATWLVPDVSASKP